MDDIDFYSKTKAFSSPLGASAASIRENAYLIGGVVSLSIFLDCMYKMLLICCILCVHFISKDLNESEASNNPFLQVK